MLLRGNYVTLETLDYTGHLDLGNLGEYVLEDYMVVNAEVYSICIVHCVFRNVSQLTCECRSIITRVEIFYLQFKHLRK